MDGFLGDDFDLIRSFWGQPPTYLLGLLASNASGNVWNDWGLDATQGRGFLRPIHIWLLKLDTTLWGIRPVGFHITSTMAFAALIGLVFRILETLGARRPAAILGAWVAAIHPIFSASVPFIAAREETLTTAFCLAAFLCFLKMRIHGAAPVSIFLVYALALLTKETAVVWAALPLGYDLIVGPGPGRHWPRRRDLLAFYGGLAALLGAYLALRYAAFGNVVAGDGSPTNYLSIAAFAEYHAQFWRGILGDPRLEPCGLPILRAAALAAALSLLVLAVLRKTAAPTGWRRQALFFGGFWYFATTAVFYGTYFDDRHHGLPLVGLALFLALAADRALGRLATVGCAAVTATAAGVMAVVLLPPTLSRAGTFSEASRVTARVRERIEQHSRHLPDGSRVLLIGTPLQEEPPYYFGWGLQSALSRPFTASDAAQRLRIFDRRDWALNRRQGRLPSTFDFEIRFAPSPPGTILHAGPPAAPREHN
ncbi:MAG TPA: hypothetical protein VKA01_18455 [Vicinamibacteria bacterium]|nr:hypothetical protein [Vicinamibacteria bacterium]